MMILSDLHLDMINYDSTDLKLNLEIDVVCGLFPVASSGCCGAVPCGCTTILLARVSGA